MKLNRALAPLKSKKRFHFGVIDVEAKNWWDLLIVGLWDGERYHHFRDIGSLLDFVCQKDYRDWRFFAHFGGRYDFNFIYQWIKDNPSSGIRAERMCNSGSMLISFKIRRGRNSVTFCDSYRLLPAKLAALTKAFKVKHQKDEHFDFQAMEFNRELLEYNEHDCRGLYEVIEAFFDLTDVQTETFASQALAIWRKDFQRSLIWKPPAFVDEFVRRTYHGGRTEVLKHKHPHLYCYDVNSMYPSVMLSPIPVEYAGHSTRLSENPDKFGFIRAQITIPEDTYIPNLPVRHKKLFFPVGELDHYFTSVELIQAIERGAKLNKIVEGYWFNTDTIFQGYVDHWYAVKQQPEPWRTIAKFMLNSLYGKFGQKPIKKVFCDMTVAPHGSWPIIDQETGLPTGFAYFETESRVACLLPHISSSITARARLSLLERMDESTYYCDTDSVFTDREMETGDELGNWSLVAEGACEFYQPKLYKFGGKYKAKGLNLAQDIDDYVRGGLNTVSRSRSVKESLRDGRSALGHVEVSKHMQDSRPKRAWVNDQDTRPWRMSEIMED